MSIPTVGYWDFRCLADAIRNLLHYKGIQFVDKCYPDSDSWHLNDKYQLNLDFPNLPYYIDDDVKLTQSTTILRYLAKKYDLIGKTEEEKVRAELAEQQIVDFRDNMIRTCYNPEFEKLKGDFVRNVPAQLKLFSAFLGDRKFMAGDSITYVDFMAYDTFDFYRLLIPTALNEFPNIKEYQDRFESLPQLQQYFQSAAYKRWPIFWHGAYFGGKGSEPTKA